MSGDPNPAFWSSARVCVTGGGGFLGRHTVRLLEEEGAQVDVVRSRDFDLRDPAACREALAGAEIVFHLAARVGGIGFNKRNPAPLAYDNLAMGTNVFEAVHQLGIRKLVAASSVCAYPLHTPVPFREQNLWDGYPEPSNAPYGLAKRMLFVLSASYRDQYGVDSCVPVIANLYGPGDNFDLEDSHVVAAMVRKYVEAAERGKDQVILWGTGKPTREFLHVEDAARALLLAAERHGSSEPVNVGTGSETSISALAKSIAEVADFEGETIWDPSRPDGQMRRYLDVTRAEEAFGFKARVPLQDGLRATVESFRTARAVA